eukprot:scaffold1837_cov102-Isochrysis_galbana.AAC.4
MSVDGGGGSAGSVGGCEAGSVGGCEAGSAQSPVAPARAAEAAWSGGEAASSSMVGAKATEWRGPPRKEHPHSEQPPHLEPGAGALRSVGWRPAVVMAAHCLRSVRDPQASLPPAPRRLTAPPPRRCPARSAVPAVFSF